MYLVQVTDQNSLESNESEVVRVQEVKKREVEKSSPRSAPSQRPLRLIKLLVDWPIKQYD